MEKTIGEVPRAGDATGLDSSHGKKNPQLMLTIRHHVLPLRPRSDMIRTSAAGYGCFSPPTSPPLMRRPSQNRTVYARVLRTSCRPAVRGLGTIGTRKLRALRGHFIGRSGPAMGRARAADVQLSQDIRNFNERVLIGREAQHCTKTNAQRHCP